MKRYISLLLALIIAFSLSACGGYGVSVSDGDSSGSSSAVPTESSSADPEKSSSANPEESFSAKPEGSSTVSSGQASVWWREGLAEDKLVCPGLSSCGDSFSYYYIYDDANKTADYADTLFSRSADSYDGYDLSLLLDSAVEAQDIGARILPDNFCEIVALDDTKYTIEFYEQGVSVTRSLPGEGKGQVVLLKLDPVDYAAARDRIAGLLSPALDSERHLAQWLCMMRQSRAETVAFYSADGVDTHVFSVSEDFYSWMWEELAHTQVLGGATSTSKTSLDNAARAEITFNNGLIYNIYITENEMLISAGGVESSLLYTLWFHSDYELFNGYAAGKLLNPPTGKPVIYLYPTAPSRCLVTLGYDSLITTVPEYNGGWNVMAYPDGRLIDLTDGGEYPYLYWDGDKQVDWDLSEGFCVAQEELEGFLREKLPYLGLIPSEYEEFIAYWLPRMTEYPYYVITFAGGQYEAAAPLSVVPAPDSLLRVHMVFAGAFAPCDIAEQTLSPFSRSGFAVVEWGGTDAGRFRG